VPVLPRTSREVAILLGVPRWLLERTMRLGLLTPLPHKHAANLYCWFEDDIARLREALTRYNHKVGPPFKRQEAHHASA
jgi:hypothetical protein